MSTIPSPAASKVSTSTATQSSSGSSSAASTKLASKGGSNKADQTKGTSFNGTLNQMMSTASQDGTQNADSSDSASKLTENLLSLLGITGAGTAASSSADGQNDTVNALIKALDALSDLLQNSEDLQDLLAANPQLMNQLQAWIQQAMQLLQGTNSVQANFTDLTADAGKGNNLVIGNDSALQELSPLAQHQETIKYALLDTIQSLKEQLTGSGTQGTSQSSFVQLVSSLQKLIGQTINQPVKEQLSQPVSVSNQLDVQATSEEQTSNTVQAVSSGQIADEDSSSKNQQSPADNSAFTGSNVVTAGQLQLRDQTAVQVKSAAPVPVEKFSQEMTGFIVNKMDIVKLQGMSEAKITLTPEHLGQVDIRITLHNGQVVAQFMTEHAFAKDSLEQQMSQLRAALQSQGLQVEKLEVTQNPSLSSHMYHDGKQPGSGSQQRQNGKRREVEEDDGVTSVETIEDWNEWVKEVQSKQDEYGSSFVAKA